MSCESCEKNVNTMYIYSFVTFDLIIFPLVSNSTKLRFFCSIPLLSFTEMFIIDPPYHNTKKTKEVETEWLAEKTERELYRLTLHWFHLACLNTIVLMHSFEKKIKFKIFPYCTGIIVKVYIYMYYFIYTLHKIHHYESES